MLKSSFASYMVQMQDISETCYEIICKAKFIQTPLLPLTMNALAKHVAKGKLSGKDLEICSESRSR